LANLIVPPFLSEGLNTLSLAALNSALVVLPEVPESASSLPPLHAAENISANAAVPATSTLDLRITCSNLPGGTVRVRTALLE
jgi:hypothetical protein